MSGWIDATALWLCDFHLLAAILLACALIALAITRQPARRMAISKAAIVAVPVLALLAALPDWSVLHLASHRQMPEQGLGADHTTVQPERSSAPFIPHANPDQIPPPDQSQAMRIQAAMPRPLAHSRRPLTWPILVVAAQLVGALLVIAWQLAGALLARRIVRQATPAPPEWLQALRALIGNADPPRLLMSSAVSSPVALGIFQPKILLPPSTAAPSSGELRSILAHEWAHIHSGDLRTVAIARFLLVLLWPQPLFLALRRTIRLDQETLADAAAAEAAGRVGYAEQLLQWARREQLAENPYDSRTPGLAGAVGLWEGPSQLRRRIAILLNERFAVMRSCSRRWRGACFAAASLAALALSLVTLQPANLAAEDQQGAKAEDAGSKNSDKVQHASLDFGVFSAVQIDLRSQPVQYKKNGLKLNVVDAESQPLADVEVLIYRISHRKRTHELAHTARTDEQGVATFDDLLTPDVIAEYEKFAAASEYPFAMDHSFLIALKKPGLSTVLTAQDGYQLAMRGSERTLMMRPAATLSGRVTDPEGRPVAGATVAAGAFSGGFAIEGVNATQTDADGRYAFTDRMAFDAEAAEKSLDVKFLSWTATSDTLVPSHDPGKPEDPAKDLHVSNLMVTHPDFAATRLAGGDVPGTTDVQLLPAAAIEGRVLHHGASEPAADITVVAVGRPADSRMGEIRIRRVSDLHEARAKTGPDGRYHVGNLPPGSYGVYADPGAMRLEEADWVSRGHNGVEAAPNEQPTRVPDIVIGPGGTIRGQLVDANTGEPLRLDEPVTAQPYLLLAGDSQMQPAPIQRVPVSTEGVFEMRTVPGKLRVGVLVYRGKQPDSENSLYQSGDDIHAAGQIFDLEHGETVEAKFPVWSADKLEQWREQTQKGHQLLADQKFDEAMDAFTALLAERPKDYSVRLSRAMALRGAGRLKEAVADFEQILAAHPEDLNSLLALSDILATASDTELRNGPRAVKLAQQLIAAADRIEHGNRDFLAQAYSRLAAAHAETGNFEKAIAAQEEAIKLAPKETKRDLQERLELYKGQTPFRRSSEPVPDPQQSSSIEKADAAESKLAPDELAGRVVDAAGQPVEGATVDVWTWFPGHETKTDADGRFRVKTGEKRDKIQLRVTKDGYSPHYIARQQPGVDDMKIVLDSGTYLEGRLSAPNGEPVDGATIRAEHAAANESGHRIGAVLTETTTDEQGRYRLYLFPETYELQIADNAGALRKSGIALRKGEAKQLDLQVEPAVRFEATVVDAATKEPFAGLILWSWQDRRVIGVSDEDGRIVIEGMMPGRFQFNVGHGEPVQRGGVSFYTHGQLGRWWSDDAVHPWDKRTVEPNGWQRNFDDLTFDLAVGMKPVAIEVERGVTFSGRVVDPEGKPVGGATVDAAKAGSGNSLTGDTRYHVRTKADGTFRAVLPAGNRFKYNLVAHDGDYQQWRQWANGVSEVFETKPGDVIEGIELRLSQTATIRGRVLADEGVSVAGKQVRAAAADAREFRYYYPTTEVSADGAFELKFVRPGRHYVQVEPFWLEAASAPEGTTATIEVKSGEVYEGVELHMAPQPPARTIFDVQRGTE